MYLLMQDVNKRGNCMGGGGRRYKGTLCTICSIFCKAKTAPNNKLY